MVKIRPHLLDENGVPNYNPSDEWPDDTVVQWGEYLSVIEIGDVNVAAFFEAFPKDDSASYIRGEGSSIAAAEEVTLAKWRKNASCDHRWCRGKYTTSGAARCAKCNAFKSSCFQPIVKPRDVKEPIRAHDLTSIIIGVYCGDPTRHRSQPTEKLTCRADRKAMLIRARRQGLELPPDDLDKEVYKERVQEPVLRFYVDHVRDELFTQESLQRHIGGVLMGYSGIQDLELRARRRGLLPEDAPHPPRPH